jgi:cephalosporin-C deacetylase-like acetyl esterase
MNLPDDFGLSPAATLAHVGALRPVTSHFAFWKGWAEAVFTPPVRLWPTRLTDPSDPTATHEFTSLRSVRIGATLLEPARGVPVRAGVVTTHGYGRPGTLSEEAARWEPFAARGVAVLMLRVRGFPGSQSDAGDLLAGPFGWIASGLETPVNSAAGTSDWVLSGAVADVVNACRAMHQWLGERGKDPGLYLHGESFGGGLAVLASAQLAGRIPVERLALALPTLGDWPWRLSRPARGPGAGSVGADVDRFLIAHRALEAQVATTLRLFDATVHAHAVRCPVLCKLALRDDVVPAPSAASVFNALSTPPGLKRRLVTAFGHFDGGLADLRRHAEFERLVGRFLDPGVPPLEALAGL